MPRRDNYSPAERHNKYQQHQQAHRNPVGAHLHPHEATSSPISHISHISQQPDHSPSSLSRSPSRSPVNRTSSPVCEMDSDPVEMVYVCDCCCINRELTPGYKHMSTFGSLFMLLNFLAFGFNLGNLGMGLWFRIDPKVYEMHKYIETQNFTFAGWIMLFGGFLGCFIAMMGFYIGASSRSKTSLAPLTLYLCFMAPITLALVGALVLLVVHGLGWQLEQFITKEIYEQMRQRSMSNQVNFFEDGGATQFLDFVQVKMLTQIRLVKLRCCGAVDYLDYDKHGLNMPTSCYTIEKNYVGAPGCGRAIRQLLDIRGGLAVGFAAASILTQVLSLIIATVMICSVYHWRAHPRPASPVSSALGTPRVIANRSIESPTPPKRLPIRQASPSSKSIVNQLDCPRSRTPIIMK